MIDEIFAKFEGAFAENTLRAYHSDFEQFSYWCHTASVEPLDPSEQDIAAYVEAVQDRLATATIRRQIASLSTILKLSGRQDMTKAPEVILALKRMQRRKGRAQKQAVPLTRDIRDQLLSVCSSDTKGLRDRVLLHLGSDTMRRRAELCRFRFEDLEQLPNGRVALRLVFSKTDQLGKGKIVPISPPTHQLLQQWGDRFSQTGFILRGVSKNGAIRESLNPASINTILQRLQKIAGIKDIGQLSGHSFRVGGAIDLLEEGEPLERIMLRGGWQSESTTIGYLRSWQAVTSTTT
ncbi:MAG: tyrosine-type recombinase/integrase [Halieaceae bacterium]